MHGRRLYYRKKERWTRLYLISRLIKRFNNRYYYYYCFKRWFYIKIIFHRRVREDGAMLLQGCFWILIGLSKRTEPTASGCKINCFTNHNVTACDQPVFNAIAITIHRIVIYVKQFGPISSSEFDDRYVDFFCGCYILTLFCYLLILLFDWRTKAGGYICVQL